MSLGLCAFCGGPGGFLPGEGHLAHCPRFKKAPKRRRTIGRKPRPKKETYR